ncbi:MAG: cytochrome c oxidase subunit 3 [Saprospiraceae bacterium]
MTRSSFGIHKSWIILVLLLSGLVMLFISSSVAMIYLQVRQDLKNVEIPSLFYFNTTLLLITSFIFHKINPALINISIMQYKLRTIFFITLLFLALQSLAWYNLLKNSIVIGSDRMGSFLYFISGLHFVHILAGIPFLIRYYVRLKYLDPTYTLLDESESAVRNFKLLRVYWHFLDFIWLYIVVFLFLLNHFF